MADHATSHPGSHLSSIPDDTDVHNTASIQVDYLSHQWKESDVWATWRNMTRQKNDIANGMRLENASWRTWWKQRQGLKTISPQTLNWLKDSDVTWLYGPLHQAPTLVPPPKVATLQDKLNIIPPLPKGRKPILKKRTLAEVLVLGLAKSTVNRTPPDELKELDLDTKSRKNPEERDRLMLLHTKSDTNLLRPAMGRVQQPSPPSDHEPPRPPRKSAFSFKKDTDNADQDPACKKHITFNRFVQQFIAVQPGADGPTDEDETMNQSSIVMKGSRRKGSTSRTNSHSSDRSDRLIIAPMAPTLLKEMADDQVGAGPALVYVPTESPFGDDSDDDFDFGDKSPPVNIIPHLPGKGDLTPGISSDHNTEYFDGEPDLGGDYNIMVVRRPGAVQGGEAIMKEADGRKRKLSEDLDAPPVQRHHKARHGDSSISPQNSSNNIAPSDTTILRDIPSSQNLTVNDQRGRTLHRSPSGSSLNERSRSRTSPMGSYSPESSRASSTASTRGSSTEAAISTQSGRGVTKIDVEAVADSVPVVTVQAPAIDSSQSQSGFVDKAMANAKGIIDTLWNAVPSPGGTSK